MEVPGNTSSERKVSVYTYLEYITITLIGRMQGTRGLQSTPVDHSIALLWVGKRECLKAEDYTIIL